MQCWKDGGLPVCAPRLRCRAHAPASTAHQVSCAAACAVLLRIHSVQRLPGTRIKGPPTAAQASRAHAGPCIFMALRRRLPLHACPYTRTHSHTHTHKQTSTCKLTHTHTHTRTRTGRPTHARANTHSCRTHCARCTCWTRWTRTAW